MLLRLQVLAQRVVAAINRHRQQQQRRQHLVEAGEGRADALHLQLQ